MMIRYLVSERFSIYDVMVVSLFLDAFQAKNYSIAVFLLIFGAFGAHYLKKYA